MKKILVIGAGLSASSMIEYLLNNSEKYDWKITVGDMSEEMAKLKIKGHKNGRAICFNINDEAQKNEEIKNADLVISMLPAAMHPIVAKACLQFKKHMATASYVSDEMKAMNEEVKKAGLIFMNEIGVDPGIDHMSTMMVLDKIKNLGGEVFSYKSFTGGLIAPKYDTNPWNYKFTWNPRNVVVAGQGTAKFLEDGELKYIPYHNLFMSYERFNVLNYGEFEGYPNRDSLKYRSIYGLDKVKTMVRGTLRRPGYCKAWDVFVQLGMTDDTYTIENSENLTYCQFTDAFLYNSEYETTEEKLATYLDIDEDSNTLYRLRWLGMFSNETVGIKNASPAKILEKILVDKWKFEDGDRDLLVMQHQFGYEVAGKKKYIKSSFALEGKDNLNTAMSMTVGLPLAIAVKLILTEVINTPGVHVPVVKEIYEPVLNELKEYGINFVEEEE